MSYTKEDIIAVFKAFDADNSGQVSNKELVTVLTKLFKDDADKAKSAAEVSTSFAFVNELFRGVPKA